MLSLKLPSLLMDAVSKCELVIVDVESMVMMSGGGVDELFLISRNTLGYGNRELKISNEIGKTG